MHPYFQVFDRQRREILWHFVVQRA